MDKFEAEREAANERDAKRMAEIKNEVLEDPAQLYCALFGPLDDKQRKLQKFLSDIHEYGASLHTRDLNVLMGQPGYKQMVQQILLLVAETSEHIEGMLEDFLENTANE